MADVPDGADVLPNPRGQAPGLRTVLDGCLIYAVPGVPREMRALVTESVLPDLIARAPTRPDVLTQTLRIAVRGESEVATLVAAGGPTPPAGGERGGPRRGRGRGGGRCGAPPRG